MTTSTHVCEVSSDEMDPTTRDAGARPKVVCLQNMICKKSASKADLEERLWRLLLSPQGTCGGAAGAYRKPAGPPIRWAVVTFSHPLRNAKTRLGQLHFRDTESISARLPPVFGEISASRAQGCLCRYAPSSSSRLSTSRSNERGSGGHGQRDLLHQPRGSPSNPLEVSGISVQ